MKKSFRTVSLLRDELQRLQTEVDDLKKSLSQCGIFANKLTVEQAIESSEKTRNMAHKILLKEYVKKKSDLIKFLDSKIELKE